MIIDIDPNFYLALSLPYNLQVKVTEILFFKFYLNVPKIFYLLEATFHIILHVFIFGIQIAAT